MAAKHISFILFLTLLSSLHTHARDSQMFNKVPSKTNENAVTQTQEIPNNNQEQEPPLNTNVQEQEQEQKEPNFTPTNENNYGLYGTHESTNTPNNFPYNAKYLPKNYNPVAYVTEPEDFSDSSFEDKSYTTAATTTTTTPQTENNNNRYYNGQQQQRNNYYNNGDNDGEHSYNYNVQREGLGDTRFINRAYTTNRNDNDNENINTMRNNNFNNGGRLNRIQPQGMSDTRFLENGRYYYDINTEKYSRDPYENSKEFIASNQHQYNTNRYNGNNDNSYPYKNYKKDNENSYQYKNYNSYMQGQEKHNDDEEYMP